MPDIKVECAQRNCRHKHTESERLRVPNKKWAWASDMVCPKCGCKSYYKPERDPAVTGGSGTK